MGDISVNKSHDLSIEDRKRMKLTGVSDVRSYDERRIILLTTRGGLVIGGSGLKITKVDTECGEADVEGNICALEYSENPGEKGLLKKLFR